MAQPSWSLPDLLDLEFFLEADQNKIRAGQEEELRRRDRQIYHEIKDTCPPEPDDPAGQRRCLLRHWLRKRRRMEAEQGKGPLPGQLFSELVRISSWLFFAAALVSGWGLSFSFLTYSGRAPINVATFLAIFVGSQLLFLILLLFFLAAGRLKTRPPLPLTYSLVQRGLFALLKKLGRRLAPSKKGHRWLEQFSGNIQARGELYGMLFMIPVFLLVQLGAMGFNIGVIAALIFKVMTTDLAFGWQTTLTTGTGAVARLVELIALPWSWLLPAGVGYPGPSQIAGSHIILKEGIKHLSTTALTSWWPFLCLSIAVYGLLPRMLLYGGGRIAAHYLLKILPFDGAAHHQLLQRMQTPILTTSERERPTRSAARRREAKKTPEPEPGPAGGSPALLLVPDELAGEYPLNTLCARINIQHGYEITGTLLVDMFDLSTGTTTFPPEVISDGPASVLILQEAWQPPVNEFLHFLGRLREALGKKTLITLFLIGKPEPDSPLTPPRSQDRAVWMNKISALGDPRLGVLSFREP